MWYQNVQLEELNPMIYHTWRGGSGTPPPTTKSLALPVICLLKEKVYKYYLTQTQISPNQLILKNKINNFNVFLHVESEYEIGFSLAITVFAAEGGIYINYVL